jgi:hypothetical protein
MDERGPFHRPPIENGSAAARARRVRRGVQHRGGRCVRIVQGDTRCRVAEAADAATRDRARDPNCASAARVQIGCKRRPFCPGRYWLSESLSQATADRTWGLRAVCHYRCVGFLRAYVRRHCPGTQVRQEMKSHVCHNGWICEAHPEQGRPHDDCAGPGIPCPRCQPDTSTGAERARLSPDWGSKARVK